MPIVRINVDQISRPAWRGNREPKTDFGSTFGHVHAEHVPHMDVAACAPAGPFRNRALAALVYHARWGRDTLCAKRRSRGASAVNPASCATSRGCDHVPVSRTKNDSYDVLVVGAGPSGAAAAYWLAQRGHRVLVVEKKRFPARRRAATASPRARCASSTTWVSRSARRSSSASTACARSRHGVTLELAWPEHPDFPPYGYVVRRRELDEMVADRAVKAGATVWHGAEAVAPSSRTACVAGGRRSAARESRRQPSRSGPAT